jgi:outer membrane lipoprotein-sorting protein
MKYYSLCFSFLFLVLQLQALDEEGGKEPGKSVLIMDTEGLPPDIVTILEGYYREQLGGEETWKSLESIRFDGLVVMANSSMPFVAYKKKPNFMKFTLNFENGDRFITAYDGSDAWKFLENDERTAPESMTEIEAQGFIDDALFGNHLLHPKMEGKNIELAGSSIVNGVRCFKLVVDLPDGQEIAYYLDFNGFSLRRKMLISEGTNPIVTTTFSNWKKVNEVTFPLTIEKKSGEDLIQRIEIEEITPNTGVADWMFNRPCREEKLDDLHPPQEDDFPDITKSLFGERNSFQNMTIQPVQSVLNPEIDNFLQKSPKPHDNLIEPREGRDQ